jgi:hypothetical protein
VLSKADLLEEELDEADQRAAQHQRPCHEEPTRDVDAVEFAARLPHALRVSSMSGAGVDLLKTAMLTMLQDDSMQQPPTAVPQENEQQQPQQQP